MGVLMLERRKTAFYKKTCMFVGCSTSEDVEKMFVTLLVILMLVRHCLGKSVSLKQTGIAANSYLYRSRNFRQPNIHLSLGINVNK